MLKSLTELDQRIRYARTEDGVNIAYWSVGSGTPMVFLPTLVSNIESEWQTHRGQLFARLAEHHQLIRYDGRGHGMSDRHPADLSMDGLLADLKAVVDELGLDRFILFAPSIAATTAIAFAAKYLERVSRIVLWMPHPSYEDYFQSSVGDALALVESNWELFVMTLSHIRVGWAQSSQAMDGAALLRDSVNQDFFLREMQVAPTLNARPLMSDVRAPTLVVCRRDYAEYELKTARAVAGSIPTATLSIVDGSNNGIWDEKQDALREIEHFLGVSSEAPTVHSNLPPYLHNRSHTLSPREADVLRFLADGRRNKEIAADLGLSVYTVARHVATIYAKIGAHGRAEATRYAIEHGIITPREVGGWSQVRVANR